MREATNSGPVDGAASRLRRRDRSSGHGSREQHGTKDLRLDLGALRGRWVTG